MARERFRQKAVNAGVLTAMLILAGDRASAELFTFAWDGSPVDTGYIVFVGTAPGVYDQVFDTQSAVPGLQIDLPPDITYYVAVQAYNESGLVSPPSIEINTAPPVPDPDPEPDPEPRLVLENPGPQCSREGDFAWISLDTKFIDPAGAGDTDHDRKWQHRRLQFTISDQPRGVHIVRRLGIIHGIVHKGTARERPYDVTITVSDGVLSDTQTFEWTVRPARGARCGADHRGTRR